MHADGHLLIADFGMSRILAEVRFIFYCIYFISKKLKINLKFMFDFDVLNFFLNKKKSG
jgi:hypothetical protein